MNINKGKRKYRYFISEMKYRNFSFIAIKNSFILKNTAICKKEISNTVYPCENCSLFLCISPSLWHAANESFISPYDLQRNRETDISNNPISFNFSQAAYKFSMLYVKVSIQIRFDIMIKSCRGDLRRTNPKRDAKPWKVLYWWVRLMSETQTWHFLRQNYIWLYRKKMATVKCLKCWCLHLHLEYLFGWGILYVWLIRFICYLIKRDLLYIFSHIFIYSEKWDANRQNTKQVSVK